MPVQAAGQATPSMVLSATVSDVTGLANLLKSVAIQTHAVVIASSSGLEIVTELNRTVQAHAYLYSHMFDSYRFDLPSTSARPAASAQSDRQIHSRKRTRTTQTRRENDGSQASAPSSDPEDGSSPDLQSDRTTRNRGEAGSFEDEPASVSFEVNLQTWISCLNIFGGVGPSRPQATGHGQYGSRTDGLNSGGSAANARGYARTRDGTADPNNMDRGASVERSYPSSSTVRATRMRLSYEGVGHPLVLELEQEANVLTRCSISTYEPSFLTDMVFDPRQMVAQVIVGSDLMHAAFSEVDATCKKLSILMTSPHTGTSHDHHETHGTGARHSGIQTRKAASMLRFRAISDTGSSEMEFPASLSSADPTGVIEKFVALPGSSEQWYDFSLLSRTMTVLRSSIKTSLRMDEAGLISFQFMMPKYRKAAGFGAAGAANALAADQASLEEEQDAFCEFLAELVVGGGSFGRPWLKVMASSTLAILVTDRPGETVADINRYSLLRLDCRTEENVLILHAPHANAAHTSIPSSTKRLPRHLGQTATYQAKMEAAPAAPPVENPREWSTLKKTRVTLILGVMVLSFTYLSTAFALSATSLQRQFNASAEVVTLGLSLYVLGFALGPLLMGPLAQTNGKRPVYVCSWILFTAFCFVMSESNNLAVILVFRLLSSIAGSSALNNAPASYGDMTTPAKYAPFFTCYGFSAFAGPSLGGLVGAFVNERAGWRWNLRHQAIFVAVVTVIGVVFVPETDHPKLKRLHDARYATPDSTKPLDTTGKARLSASLANSARSFGNAFVRSVKLPFHWLFTDRVVLVISIYTSLLYAIIYDFFVIIPFAFTSIRRFKPESIGLIYITLFIGFAMAASNYLFVQEAINRLIRAKSGKQALPPETSLIHAIYGCALAPVGLFLFAWTVPFTSIHWIVPAIGIVLLCAGSMSAFTSLIPYLVAYGGPSAPSVLAAAGFCRSALAAALPLFTRQMCRSITVQGAASLLGGLALLLTPLPFLLYIHGGKLREHVRQKKEALAAAGAAASAPANVAGTGGKGTPEKGEPPLAIGARIPPGGAVEDLHSRSSLDISSAPSDDVA